MHKIQCSGSLFITLHVFFFGLWGKHGFTAFWPAGCLLLLLNLSSSHLSSLLLDVLILFFVSLNALLDVVNRVVCYFFFVGLESLSLSVLVSADCVALFIEEELVLALVVAFGFDFLELSLWDWQWSLLAFVFHCSFNCEQFLLLFWLWFCNLLFCLFLILVCCGFLFGKLFHLLLQPQLLDLCQLWFCLLIIFLLGFWRLIGLGHDGRCWWQSIRLSK